ncbi:MAG: hypothetical protein PHT14_04380 [Petrimonas sp.]|jgi:hypothetical protein|nr:hypothetical protein [Petrimonas sp.]MDD3542750.1 hypothetical protein [Petrimonas sp.]
MNNYRLILCFTILIACFSTKGIAQKKGEFSIGNIEVQFIRTGVEGTVLFKVFSYGKNYDRALENAKPNAVKAVIFKGIPGSDISRPMVNEYELSTSQRQFFEDFFNNGNYLNYVSISGDGSVDPSDVLRIKRNQYKVGVVVSVQKAALRKYLEETGIVKALDAGF